MFARLDCTLLVLALLAPLAVDPASAQQATPSDPSSTAQRATVVLRIAGPTGFSTATGFLAPGGILVTANHALSDASAVDVRLQSGQTVSASGILHADPTLDLALLKVDGPELPSVPLDTTDDVAVGQPLVVLSSPAGADLVVSKGVLSSAQLISGRRILRLSVPASRDNSGAPVLSEKGTVVGMVVSGISGNASRNLAYALPISQVRQAISSLDGRGPTPFAPKPVVATQNRTSFARGGSVNLPGVVNEDLEVDYSVLHGAEVSTAEFQSDRERFTNVRYSMATDVAGIPALEKESSELTRVPNPAGPFSRIDNLRVDMRSAIRIDGSRIDLFRQQTALSEAANKLAGTVDIAVADTVASLSSSSHPPTMKWVPKGVVPAALKTDVVAALPDSLPEQIFLWTVEIDTTGARVIPTRFRFSAPITEKVPISKSGHKCVDKKVKDTKMKVTPVTETTGAVSVRYFVLSSRPHLKWDQSTTCIRLPSARAEQ